MSKGPAQRTVRLNREVRFTVNGANCVLAATPGQNGYAGVPAIRGMGQYFALRVEVEGALDPATGYLLNIRDIDTAVRERAVPLIVQSVHAGKGNASIMPLLFDQLQAAWQPTASLRSLRLLLSPFTSVAATARELPMVRFSQKFEFSASHRLHSPALSESENRELFGKCNNPHGHGHNYEVQVTLLCDSGVKGDLVDVQALERLVNEFAISPLDHRYLNVEIPEFRDVIPSVENIARDIYGRLKRPLDEARLTLLSVTVWETPKTWAEYQES